MVTLPANEAIGGAILALSVGVGFVVVRLVTRKIAELPAFSKKLSDEDIERLEEIGG